MYRSFKYIWPKNVPGSKYGVCHCMWLVILQLFKEVLVFPYPEKFLCVLRYGKSVHVRQNHFVTCGNCLKYVR